MKNETKAVNISIAAIGEKLRTAREKKSLAIDQVQKQTHIHSTVLNALEEGRCDEMLTPTYVKSFLKKYSDYLGLNSREILQEYSNLHHEAPAQSLTIDNKIMKESADLSGLLYAARSLISIILILSVAIFLGAKVVGHFKKIGPAQTKQLAARYKPQIKAQPKENAAPPLVPKSVPLKVLLVVKAPVWVEAKRDGEKLFQRVLKKGTKELVTAREKIELDVAKAEAVEIVLNGRQLGSPGKGIVKDIEITRKGMRIR